MSGATLDSFSTFGELLKHLRRRMQMTQQELGNALGYSQALIARLEGGERLPELAHVKTAYVKALGLQHEPALAKRLIELAEQAHARLGVARAMTNVPCPTNLVLPLTRFIGRARELEEFRKLLGSHDTLPRHPHTNSGQGARLVTMTGSGGVGKTRLAIEVGMAFVVNGSPYPDGVWRVELAAVVDGARVPQAGAQVFQLLEYPDRTPTETLVRHLEAKFLLLILDNCEHVISACAELAEALLSACPHLRLLATSREPLRVPGEVTRRVPSLSTPDPAHPLPLKQLLDYEAVQLFVEHASAARQDFIPTPENLASVVQICRRLDGIPLAIEMAAARVRTMDLAEIVAGLDHRFTLLTSGRRTALPRQQTLRATIEWSYQLLSEPERVVLACLSVLADGCFADGVQAASDASAAPAGAGDQKHYARTYDSTSLASSVLPLLLSLVDQSLVVTETRNRQTRYRLPETVRQFAAEKLRQRGEEDAVRERYTGHLIWLAAVLMLGAEGAWLGSRFVASHEALAPEWKKQRVVQAGTDDTRLTKVYDLLSGAPFPHHIGDRVLTNSFTAEWHGREQDVMARRAQLQERWDTAEQAGDDRISRVQMGNATGLILSVEPAGSIVRRIVEEAEAILRSRPHTLLKSLGSAA
jgi:predicted ATPase/transcriptional regulator with XRE-family HTH domain